MKSLIVAVALLALVAGPTRAQPSSAEDRAHIAAIENGLLPAVVIKGRPFPAATLDGRMRATKTPGVSIAFFEDGRIRWTRTYGLADVASGRPVTAETLFQAASISKPVAATAALRLMQDGRLSLDDDVNMQLKDWRLPDSAFTADRKVTLRGLLSHTAGLTVSGFPGYPPGGALPEVVQILNGQAPANTRAVISNAVPGARWSYSGGGYTVVQQMMTEATGKPFPDVMRDLVLKPAGMSRSTFAQPLPESLGGQAATGYLANGQPLPGLRYAHPELAAAGLWTTPSDLARFAIALQNAHAGSSRKILNQATARTMLTRQMSNYGLGPNLGPAEGPAMFQHGGSNQGFRSELRAFTSGSRQGVVIMANGDGADVLIGEIRRAVAQAYGWKGSGPEERTVVQVEPTVLSTYLGLYEVPGLTTLNVTAADGRLYVAASALGPDSRELLAASPAKFFVLENGVTIEFVKDAQGVATTAKIGGPFGAYEATRKP
ncbi:serine hydrolase [Phenylobacterium sp.]|uniref:serine hydrolase n=1 Tax=Phenylobacterium sp. TaxID=1871053 RepID=UPI0027335661|nr:serine hydrolase [Phenylobacterium sp.]MDP3854109.1 serine hydrolase [Phenylobacterium sp.]